VLPHRHSNGQQVGMFVFERGRLAVRAVRHAR